METNQKNDCFIDGKRHPQGYEICTYEGCMVCTEGGWIQKGYKGLTLIPSGGA